MKVQKIGSLDDNEVIWRYMSLEKFINLILDRSLYFANANKMEDNFELAVPIYPFKESKEMSNYGRGMVIKKTLTEKELTKAKAFKENTYVSCWSRDKAESYALWKIYLGGSSNGVAIKSTVSKLIQCLESVDPSENKTIDSNFLDNQFGTSSLDLMNFKIGEVDYKNYIEWAEHSKTKLAITKKEYYGYEKEIRVFCTSKNQYLTPSTEEYMNGLSNGFYILIEIENLIDGIVMSPYSDPWFKENLKTLIDKLNKKLSNKIEESKIILNSH